MKTYRVNLSTFVKADNEVEATEKARKALEDAGIEIVLDVVIGVEN